MIPVGDTSEEEEGEPRPRLVAKLWNLTKVTVKEEADTRELENLCLVSHPNILLLMAVCPGHEDLGLQLVFQHAPLGSLHHWLHVQVSEALRQCQVNIASYPEMHHASFFDWQNLHTKEHNMNNLQNRL